MSPIINEDLLQHMEDILLGDLAIEQARILDIAHPTSSTQDLVVAVVLSDLVEQTPEATRHVRESLIASVARLGGAGQSLVPRKWATLPSLPVDASGDVDDDALKATLLARAEQKVAVKKAAVAAAAAIASPAEMPASLKASLQRSSKTCVTSTVTPICAGLCVPEIPLDERRGSAVSLVEVA